MRMKLLVFSLFVACGCSKVVKLTDHGLAQWEMFKSEHEKEYKTEQEERRRQKIFLSNVQFIEEHNSKYENGEVTFKVATNKFADMNTEEFNEVMKGLRIPAGHQRTGKSFDPNPNLELPKAVDWRKKGAVTHVKDQGECGSCWAFSATGSLEGQAFKNTKKLISLSEQNLIDCSGEFGNRGCRGGAMDYAFDYMKENDGIDTEDSYPYEEKNGTCRYLPSNKGASDSGFVDLPSGDEKALQQAVANIGPISVAIDSSSNAFQFYKSGIYKDLDCSPEQIALGHAVLAVGYGHLNKSGDYYLVKNSWCTRWGIKGYILMARNNNNMCGIATAASYPIV